MARFKKALSIVLCLTMLLGTLTIGLLSVSAAESYTNKSYADLVTAYSGKGKFFYMGVEFYDTTTGEIIKDTDAISPGQEITVKCSIKSDYSVYAGTYFFVFDGNIFEFVTGSGVADDKNGMAVTAVVPARTAKFYSVKNNVATITPAFQSYTAAQMDTWTVVRVMNNNTTSKLPRTTNADGVTFSYRVKVKEEIGTAKTGLDCSFKMFPETFSCYAGDSTTYSNQCYLDGTDAANKNVKAENFEISGSRTFETLKTIKFVDESGNNLFEKQIKKAGEKINLDDYVPTADGKTFKSWSLNGAMVSGEYTVSRDASFKPIWEGDEGKLKIMTTNSEGEWVQLTEYFGGTGDKLTLDDLDVLLQIANDNTKKIGDELGLEGVEPKIKGIYFNDDGEFTNITAATFRLNAGNDKLKFENIKEVYIASSFDVTANTWAPNITDDGTLNEKEPQVLLNKDTTTFQNDNLEGKYIANGKSIDEYVWFFRQGQIGESNVTGNELAADLYTLSYENGNGKVLKFDAGSTAIALTADDFTEGKTLTLDFYTKATSNVFYVAIDAGADNYVIADKEFHFGDTVDAKAFEGQAFRAATPTTKFNFADLYKDGTDANMPGSTLKSITYERLDNSVDLSKGSFKIDAKSVSDLKKSVGNSNLEKGAKFLVLKAKWEAGEYDFTVLYQNAEGNYVELSTKTYRGSEKVTPSNFLTEDLVKIAKEDAPEGAVPNLAQFEKEDGTVVYSINAYDGPMTLKLSYNKDERYGYIDYANLEKLAEGEEAKEGANYSYKKLAYGDVIYTPNYDYDANGTDNAPYFNSFVDTLVIPTNPELTYKKDADGNIMYQPLTKVVYEDDGVTPKIDPVTLKPVTEPVMRDVVDKDGNPVLDANGKPVQEETPDTSKPIVAADPKGDCVYRPYRNCEYVGYKVYHVEGIYKSYSSVMAVKDQWVEGYEDSENRIYQTDILVMQWKSDADFKYRIFTMGKSLHCAKGNDGKMYYWNSNGAPCNRGDGALNANENNFILYFRKRTEEAKYANGETGSLTYYYAFTIGFANLHPRFLPDLFPLIMKLLKGLL